MFVEKCGLMPGVTITVQSRDTAADAVVVKPDGRKPITIGSAAAEKILAE